MILSIDHLVLTVRSIESTCEFYARVLQFIRQDSPGRPTALKLDRCKINVHQVDHLFEPKAHRPTPGSADFCLITEWAIDAVIAHLATEAVAIEIGPVARTGAQGEMISVYFRDPDHNLVEVSAYI